MKAYYNDIDRFCCDWLSNLMDAGLITSGVIDDTDIREINAGELKGFNRVHFFAGIGGWELALNWAGWGEREAWTGSCPCQPFSSAGQGKGASDERHLWPAFFELIAECEPPVCFGEQVSGKLGIEWITAVRLDLESVGYVCGAADLPAAGIGAPHIRQRVYWLADCLRKSHERSSVAGDLLRSEVQRKEEFPERSDNRSENVGGEVGGSRMGDTDGDERTEIEEVSIRSTTGERSGDHGLANGALDNAQENSRRDKKRSERPETERTASRRSSLDGDAVMGNTDSERSQRRLDEIRECEFDPWTGSSFVACSDGKARPVKSGILPVAHGISNRVERIRAYGNAIVPQLAAKFIQSYMEI